MGETSAQGPGDSGTAASAAGLVPSTVISLPDGSQVTLLPLDQLEAEQSALLQQAEELRNRANLAGLAAEQPLVEAGRLLLTQPDRWQAAPSLDSLLKEARQHVAGIEAVQGEAAEIQTRQYRGLGGVVRRLTDGNRQAELGSLRTQTNNQLRVLLAHIAEAAPSTTFADADSLRVQAKNLADQERTLLDGANERRDLYEKRATELKARKQLLHQTGFDGLYEGAWMLTHGLAPVDSPLILKRNERAYLSVAATLARMTTQRAFVGRSRGLSIPIGLGIRYRVGSFAGHPVSRQLLAPIDSGHLVLSNQRIAFLGARKSVSIPLDKVMHVESYTDGVAILKEGRENADTYLMAAPGRFVMELNFLLEHPDAQAVMPSPARGD